MVAPSIQCYSAKSADAFWLFIVYTVACKIPIPFMMFIDFFLSIVIFFIFQKSAGLNLEHSRTVLNYIHMCEGRFFIQVNNRLKTSCQV